MKRSTRLSTNFGLFLASCILSFAGPPPVPDSFLLPEINGPVLSGTDAIDKMRVIKPYKLELVAEEPAVMNPVVMRFDELGRLWVVEMVGFMNDIKGTQELDKVGRISILEDTTGDSKLDKATVFLDQLVEPRAIAFHKNGILWADTKKLYHTVVIDGDKPGKTIVVDENYGPGKSVEHKTNGLIRAIDNWYYNAKSKLRYKEVDGKWLIEETEYRGQFSLSADNHGRLYHGQQNTFMRADIFAPNFFLMNPQVDLKITRSAWLNNVILPDCFCIKVNEQPVYPVRRNMDMRDAWTKPEAGHVDEHGFSNRATSACGHFFYRDNYFPETFDGIIAEPAVHMVKVLTIERKNGIPYGRDTFSKEEIIASPDTRFRPVEIRSGPDGTIYIADMYHGIIQHKIYMNAHLTKLINEQKLDAPDYLGRIYRLSIDGKKGNAWKPIRNAGLDELVKSLASKNPWRRDHAQRILVDRRDAAAAGKVEALLESTELPLAKMHALWTLEGLGAIKESHIIAGLAHANADVRIHATRISWQFDHSDALLDALLKAIPSEFAESAYYVSQRVANFPQERARAALTTAYLAWHKEPFFMEGLISGSGDHTMEWIKSLPLGAARSAMLSRYVLATTKEAKQTVDLTGADLKVWKQGERAYMISCFACHNVDGSGLPEMGPPLVGSEWVLEQPERFAKILLHGMQGPIMVKGKHYKPTAAMPGLGTVMNDQQLAEIMTYVGNSWGNSIGVVDRAVIAKARKATADRSGPYTPEELGAK